ncbi:MAG: hypothetical protein LBS98_03445 [Coriobacteriales bacterium]|jgi:predicted Fe-Mo cluster-binding NifX family protein|nr:hypothetical protein [Coriobacteriales bacterium]
MSHLVAVTTRDGKVVQEHFGHAQHFHIVRIEGDSYTYVESRESDPSCHGEGHDTSSFDTILALLHDCDAVVTAQIGPGASAYVISRGLRVFEARGFVDEILTELASSGLLDKE